MRSSDTGADGVNKGGLSPLRLFGFARGILRGLFEHHAFDHAATMAFYFFLGLIPLVLCAGLIAGTIVESHGADVLLGPLYRAMPRVAADLFRSEMREVASAQVGTVAPLSVLGFVWLTTNGVHNLMDVFELLLHAPPRPWWQQRLLSTAWLAGVVAAFALATWGVLLLGGISLRVEAVLRPLQFVGQLEHLLEAGWRRGSILFVLGAISTAALAVFYRLAVRRPPGFRPHVWGGTIVAQLLWVAVSWGFATYVRTIAHYAIFYGSLATVAIVLLWLYLTSLALLVGAEVNARVEGVVHE